MDIAVTSNVKDYHLGDVNSSDVRPIKESLSRVVSVKTWAIHPA